ncbi:pre-peptidase C-terminal domain-containing protein [Treponema primitia]|uniref:pre-peptidase C-terminal domain-containing protein n=1 Tax=Treponema primitia TaxID=88058 RepID=UPI0002554DAA|nr:pre-peptidase C-terminal domain-containing protein [Treponema primitia]
MRCFLHYFLVFCCLSLSFNLYAQNYAGDSYEPDSEAKPVPIQLGTWVSRALHAGDGDWFSIRPASDGLLIAETSGDTDTIITLYRRNEIIAQNDDNGDDINALLAYPVQSGVGYTICVEGYDESEIGPYRFRVSMEPIRDSGEPNDVPSQATPFSPGSPRTAYFLDPDDVDWYRYTVPSSGTLVVYTEGIIDTLITIYDAADNLLAEDDDSGENSNARASARVSPGTVFIRVSAYDGQLGKYTLQALLYEPAKPDRFENDDTKELAKDISVGASQERNFTDASDEDWVRLRITQRGIYDIYAKAADNTLDTYLELYNANDELIDANDDWTGDVREGDIALNARLWLELNPGTYYIKVSTLSSDPIVISAYVLSVTNGLSVPK